MRLFSLTFVLFAASVAHAGDVELAVLDRDGKPLPDAVVVIESTVTGNRPTPPAELLINQEKMKFSPALAVVNLSTKVRFANLDRFDHHVRGGAVGPGGMYLDASKGYSFRLTGRESGKPADSAVQTFAQTGPQMLGCHLHASMRAFLYVTDSPWAAITGADGKVKVAAVPNGAARLRIWHADELVETPIQNLTVTDGMAVVKVNTAIVPRKAKRAVQEADKYGY